MFNRRNKSRWGRRSKKSSLSYIKKEKKSRKGLIYEVIQWIFMTIIAVFLGVALVYAFGIRTSMVGDSMQPTLQNGQEVLINKIAYQFFAPSKGDVIVFRPNGNENAHYSIKRVIATPGDTILIENGKVIINGKIDTKDVADDTKDAGIASEAITLGADEYFVLGDNRNASEDSRSANIGNISRGMIEGKAWYHLAGKGVGKGKIE